MESALPLVECLLVVYKKGQRQDGQAQDSQQHCACSLLPHRHTVEVELAAGGRLALLLLAEPGLAGLLPDHLCDPCGVGRAGKEDEGADPPAEDEGLVEAGGVEVLPAGEGVGGVGEEGHCGEEEDVEDEDGLLGVDVVAAEVELVLGGHEVGEAEVGPNESEGDETHGPDGSQASPEEPVLQLRLDLPRPHL